DRMLAIWRSGAPGATAQTQARAPAPAGAHTSTSARTPVHPSAHTAGQARAHAAAGLRTRYLTYDTVYWNDEPPDVRAPAQPSPARATAERDLPAARKTK